MSAEGQDGFIEAGALLRVGGKRFVFEPEFLLICGQGFRLTACASKRAIETCTRESTCRQQRILGA